MKPDAQYLRDVRSLEIELWGVYTIVALALLVAACNGLAVCIVTMMASLIAVCGVIISSLHRLRKAAERLVARQKEARNE